MEHNIVAARELMARSRAERFAVGAFNVDNQETLLAMMQSAGLAGCRYHNLMGGVVALHRGYRT